MILTGPAIETAVKNGRVVLEPFDAANLNPNSYNYHLGETLLILGSGGRRSKKIKLDADGFILEPGQLYLGTTKETIGSEFFVTLLLGRSSVGRLGIFLNVTADLGHIGSRSRWTLELTVVQPVRIYPHMKIGQVSFWMTDHRTTHRYKGRYHKDARPVPNRDHKLNLSLK